MSPNSASRTVVVVGGGTVGIIKAVEQAESGNFVYLVEDSPAIAGHDVGGGAALVLARMEKLKDRIQVLTMADLVDLAREDGKFKIKLRKRASRVVAELCNGCDACSQICPATMGDQEGGIKLLRTAIDTQTPYGAGYNILKETPPCQEACPIHLDIRGYVGFAADGKYRESLELIRQRLPLTGVIGRICTHPCETACNRGPADAPVAICALKRFVADWERTQPAGVGSAIKPTPATRSSGKKVAVIGSGPAGLTCAYELVKLGHDVDVFEALPLVGGMLRVGIPEYRLPRDILDGEIGIIQKAGVKVKTNTALGKDVTIEGLLSEGYSAIFVAVGAHRGQKLGVPGDDARGVFAGVDFLRELNLGHKSQVGRNVVVVGGGNVAVDSARSARRLGATKVTIVYRRTRAEMPANDSEIKAALAEGIDVAYLVAPVKVLVEGGAVHALRCMRMELGAPDRTGRRAPVPVAGSEFEIEADMVIPAIGQEVDPTGLEKGGLKTVGGRVAADATALSTERKGVFAGGDAVTGPRTAIEAVAAGRRAAESIDRYLRNPTKEVN